MQKSNNSQFVLINDKLNELENLKKTSKFWNIDKEQGEFLLKIVIDKNPQSILEIGTSNGYSTLYLAKNLSSSSKITTIEINDERFEIAKQNFNDCKIQNIIQIKGEITEILNSNKLDNMKFDFIFLDAMQREYLNIIKAIEQKNILTKDVTIIADNVLSHGNMKEFIEYMQKNYTCEIIKLGGGFIIGERKN